MKLIPFAASCLSAITLALSPLVEASAKAEQQSQIVNQYLKETGLTTKKLTVGQYWRSVRHGYPDDMRKLVDRWVAINHELMMPTFEANSFKDASGQEQVRVTMSDSGQSISMTYTSDEAFPFKVNAVSFSKKEINEHNLNKMMERLVKEDSSIKKYMDKTESAIMPRNTVMGLADFNSLTVYQKAEYLIRLRKTMRAAQNVIEKVGGHQALEDLNKKYQWVQNFFFGDEAGAVVKKTTKAAAGPSIPEVGQECVVAGYISVYGENKSCGGNTSGRQNLQNQMQVYSASCSSSGAVPCNPLVYGFKSGSEAFCVPPAQVKYATENCNSQSPIATPEDKKRLIESFLNRKGKNIDLKFNAEGKISKEQYEQIKGYLGDLNGLIGQARGLCGDPSQSPPIAADAKFQKVLDKREDQKSACTALLTRAFDLSTFLPAPEPAAVPIEPPPPVTCSEKPGSVPTPGPRGAMSCECPMGTNDTSIEDEGSLPAGGCVPAVVQEYHKKKKKKAEDDCDFFCKNGGLLAAGGIAVGAGLLIYFMTRNNNKPPTAPTLYPPYGPPQTTCTPPLFMTSSGVCGSGYVPPVVVNPPSVVTPPAIVPSEGGTGVSTPFSGGIRQGVRGGHQ